MNNKGKITVFLCLMISVLLVLCLFMLRIVSVQGARLKSIMCTRTALSNVQAGYNRYIYDHYHILLFDKTGNGKGEGYVEQQLHDNLQLNLGDEFAIDDMQVTAYEMLYDNACQAFKNQIADYVKYAAIEYGTDYVKTVTGGKDGTLPDSIFEQRLGSDESSGGQDLSVSASDDPRKETKWLTGGVLLKSVVPDDLTVSEYFIKDEDIVPIREVGFFRDVYSVDSKFEDLGSMKSDMKAYEKWSDSLAQAGANVAYASSVFNNALEQDVNDTAVMCCELEYLICGMPTDGSNLEGVINRIIGIRMPINYMFLCSNPEKKALIVEVAAAISIITLIPISILEQLIAAGWAYAEAVAEVRHLLHGDKMPFEKTNANWITDLTNLKTTMNEGGAEDKKGLGYKDYLLILLSLNNDKCLYRMLDLIQLNARQENEKFQMINAATGLEVNVVVESAGQVFYIKEKRSY